MKNLAKLQNLCNAVNRRYESGLNDDDQVKRMFDFEKQTNDVCVIIGYDKYHAISMEELKTIYSDKSRILSEDENTFSFYYLENTGQFKARKRFIQ